MDFLNKYDMARRLALETTKKNQHTIMKTCISLLLVLIPTIAAAQNPILRETDPGFVYAADPAEMNDLTDNSSSRAPQPIDVGLRGEHYLDSEMDETR